MFTLRYFVVSGFLEVVWSHFSELYVLAVCFPPGGGDSHMKRTGMLVVSLRGVNFEFWSRLGCSGQSANILCRQGLAKGSAKKHRIMRRETEVKFSF